MSVKWNIDEYVAKASKGSFAARAARADVYKNNCEIFQSGEYITTSGKVVKLNPSAMLAGTVVYDASCQPSPVGGETTTTHTGVANIGSIELGVGTIRRYRLVFLLKYQALLADRSVPASGGRCPRRGRRAS